MLDELPLWYFKTCINSENFSFDYEYEDTCIAMNIIMNDIACVLILNAANS
jgi:hypothetical protein